MHFPEYFLSYDMRILMMWCGAIMIASFFGWFYGCAVLLSFMRNKALAVKLLSFRNLVFTYVVITLGLSVAIGIVFFDVNPLRYFVPQNTTNEQIANAAAILNEPAPVLEMGFLAPSQMMIIAEGINENPYFLDQLREENPAAHSEATRLINNMREFTQANDRRQQAETEIRIYVAPINSRAQSLFDVLPAPSREVRPFVNASTANLFLRIYMIPVVIIGTPGFILFCFSIVKPKIKLRRDFYADEADPSEGE